MLSVSKIKVFCLFWLWANTAKQTNTITPIVRIKANKRILCGFWFVMNEFIQG
jgi:hypothetical protein